MVRHVILWQLKDEYSEDEKQTIRKGIKEGLESLYITGAGKKGGKLVKDLVKRLSKEVKVSSGESIIYSPKSYEEMAGKQAVVFVETAGDSRYDEISKEIELADQSKVKIMGFILIQR